MSKTTRTWTKKKMLSNEEIIKYKECIKDYLQKQYLPYDCYVRHKRCISIVPHRHALAYVLYVKVGLTLKDTTKIIGYKSYEGVRKAVEYTKNGIDINDKLILNALEAVKKYFLNN